MIEVPVLIVGGGPVGLTASIMLSRHGVPSLLVERHPGTAVHPKSRGINMRTMEIYRQLGLEAGIRAAGLPPDRARFIVWTRTLAGEELERRVPGRASATSQAMGPVPNCLCAQDDLEPVLRAAAEREAAAILRFGAELTALAPDATGATATVVRRDTGTTDAVRARWVIAADGAQSRVRRGLGIRMVGREAVYESVNVLLRADLTPWTAHRPAALYFVELPELKGTFLTINGRDRWGFLVNSLTAYGLAAADFTPERCVELVRLAVGAPTLPVEILGVAPWTAAAHVAERYRDGAVFLAGDAAHEMPPTGGFGLNTGVQDAHNLSWKLAAVHHGWADAALLDTYDAERRPVGRAITEQALANSISMGRLGPGTAGGHAFARPEFLNEQGLIFGAAYGSAAVMPDGTPPPPVTDPVTEYVPSARPGHRAPHVWLARGGERCSTIDLFGARFVLLTGPRGAPWRAAAQALAAERGLPLDAYTVGGGELADPDGGWPAAYGVDDDGAVLVRPDGHVGWRSGTSGPPDALEAALAGVLGHASDAVAVLAAPDAHPTRRQR